MKILTIIVVSGFKFNINVRSVSFDNMFERKLFELDKLISIAHGVRINITTISMLIINIKVIDGMIVLNDAGSKDEKMSVIISKHRIPILYFEGI